MSTANAFRIIARSTLRHITANEIMVQRSDSEGVHQMRVDRRRVLSTISLFSKLFGDKQTERINSELDWLERGELSPTRDLDVYERGTVEPLRHTAPATRGMK
jgi:inorganic triphosphatase YgiF